MRTPSSSVSLGWRIAISGRQPLLHFGLLSGLVTDFHDHAPRPILLDAGRDAKHRP
jgi:hypothetical protein